VRLRDIQDLLSGTGLGADAAVVMEAKMIEALLSEKARNGAGSSRRRRGSGCIATARKDTERRLEETAADLARLEDLIAEGRRRSAAGAPARPGQRYGR